jgi:hypothetical protein
MADSARLYEPPKESLKASLIKWGKGKILFRVHDQRFAANAFNPSRLGNARFSPIFNSAEELIPTIYAGNSLECALMETVFHDVPFKAGFKPLSRTRLLKRVFSRLHLSRDLKLIDLSSIALRKLGVPRSALIDTTKFHYPRTRRWAEAFHRQFPVAEGLRWTSRQDDRAQAMVLFGDRVPSNILKITAASTLLLHEEQPISPVLDLAIRLGVTLVEE